MGFGDNSSGPRREGGKDEPSAKTSLTPQQIEDAKNAIKQGMKSTGKRWCPIDGCSSNEMTQSSLVAHIIAAHKGALTPPVDADGKPLGGLALATFIVAVIAAKGMTAPPPPHSAPPPPLPSDTATHQGGFAGNPFSQHPAPPGGGGFGFVSASALDARHTGGAGFGSTGGDLHAAAGTAPSGGFAPQASVSASKAHHAAGGPPPAGALAAPAEGGQATLAPCIAEALELVAKIGEAQEKVEILITEGIAVFAAIALFNDSLVSAATLATAKDMKPEGRGEAMIYVAVIDIVLTILATIVLHRAKAESVQKQIELAEEDAKPPSDERNEKAVRLAARVQSIQVLWERLWKVLALAILLSVVVLSILGIHYMDPDGDEPEHYALIAVVVGLYVLAMVIFYTRSTAAKTTQTSTQTEPAVPVAPAEQRRKINM